MTDAPRTPWPRRIALLALLALVLFFLREAVFAGRVFFVRDIHLQWYGQAESFVHAVAGGDWPLWDPFVGFGQPLLANANNEVLYPLTWLNLLMRPWSYYTLFFGLHLWLSAAGVYALGRRWEISRAGSFVAAAVWTASGPVLSLGNLWNHLAAAAWIPWALVAAEVALASGRLRHVLLWGAALAAQVLAGSPDYFVMTALLAVAVALRHVEWRNLVQPAQRRTLVLTALAFAFALALAAGQLLPSLVLAAQSGRYMAASVTRSYWSLHPLGLLQLAVPLWWSDLPLRPEHQAVLFESREPLLLSLYLGLPVLGLALASFATSRRPARGLLLFAAVCAALFALGPHGPLYDAALAVLPFLKVLRFPSKAILIVAFSAALLAGMGFDAWREPPTTERRRWLFVALPLAILAVLLGLAAVGIRLHAERWGPALLVAPPAGSSYAARFGPTAAGLGRAAALAGAVALLAALRRGAWAARAAAAVGVLAVVDLAVAHRGLNPTAPRELFTLRPELLRWVPQPDAGRLYVFDYLAERGLSERELGRPQPYLVATEAPPLWAGALAMRLYPVPPVAAAWGVFQSYSRDLLGIQPRDLALLNALLIRSGGTPLQSRLLRLGAVARVAALHTRGLEDLVPIATLPGPFPEPIRVSGVPDALPRAYAVAGVRVASGPEAVEILADPSFDPAREVVLAEGQPRTAAPATPGVVRIRELRADRLRLEAELTQDAYVVLVDAYDPGWRASVDGMPVPVLKANLGFRAVAVPAGRHVIEMIYRPWSVTLGLAMTGIALVLGAALWLRDGAVDPMPGGA